MVAGRERSKIICKWLTSQLSISEFNLVVDLSNGEVRIKIPLLYRLNIKEGARDLYTMVKGIRNRLSSSVPQLHRLIEVVTGMCNQNSIQTVMEKAKLSR